MNDNIKQQALSHFLEAGNINSSIHALKFRSDSNPQIKALLPIIVPQLEGRIETLVELAISQWQSSKKTG